MTDLSMNEYKQSHEWHNGRQYAVHQPQALSILDTPNHLRTPNTQMTGRTVDDQCEQNAEDAEHTDDR